MSLFIENPKRLPNLILNFRVLDFPDNDDDYLEDSNETDERVS